MGFVVRLGARLGEREADQRAPPNLGTISEMQLIGNREIHAKVFKRGKKALQTINQVYTTRVGALRLSRDQTVID